MDEAYRKATAAGLAFLVCMEVMYFALSPAPSFWIPSMDAIGQTAIGRDFLNIWIGGRAALSDGPAVFFDYWAYNVYLQSFFSTGDLHHYFWSYPPHILLFIWPFGLMPYLAAFAAWSITGLVTFLLAARAGGIERKNLLFVAVAPAVAVNLFFGQNGFFFAALMGLVRTTFSDYPRLRARLGLTLYEEGAMRAKLEAAGFAVERAPKNIGHSRSRMTFLARA